MPASPLSQALLLLRRGAPVSGTDPDPWHTMVANRRLIARANLQYDHITAVDGAAGDLHIGAREDVATQRPIGKLLLVTIRVSDPRARTVFIKPDKNDTALTMTGEIVGERADGTANGFRLRDGEGLSSTWSDSRPCLRSSNSSSDNMAQIILFLPYGRHSAEGLAVQ